MHPGQWCWRKSTRKAISLTQRSSPNHRPTPAGGPLLVKGFQGAKFIPALSNSRRGPGQFDLIANYEKMFNPDSGPAISTHINRDDTNR
jgi:hypothetical protein